MSEMPLTQHYYRLNDLIEFCPLNKTLRSLTHPQNHTTLTAPAALCLRLLLDRHSDVILQNEFYPYVWGNDAAKTTTNTLYQNISLVRRGLSYIEKDFGNVIQTVPRQGFRLDRNVKIELIPYTDAPKSSSAIKITKEDREAISTLNLLFFNKAIIVISCATITLALVYILLINKTLFTEKNHFGNYLFLSKREKCIFFMNQDAHDSIQHSKIVRTQSFNCKKYPYVYITAYDAINSAAYTSCQRSLKDYGDANCVSTYIREIE